MQINLGNVRVGLSPGKGRGLFSTRSFNTGDDICHSFSWQMSPEDISMFDETSMGGHWFEHPDAPGYGLLPIGLAALVNHSLNPNASLIWEGSPLGYIGIMSAIKPISIGDEISISYGIDQPADWI